jgi:hypothetical protein
MMKIIGFSVLALAAVGCAATTDEPELAGAEEAVTAIKYFDCSGGEPDWSLHRIEVGYTRAKLTVTDLSNDAVAPTDGTYDPTYNPSSSTYAGSRRYVGFDDLSEVVGFMVSKELQDGAAQGKIWLRTQASDGGGTTSYWCKEKANRITVDTNRKARLMCDLQMVCTEDNPPGSTCLNSAFLQQTGDNTAKLRTEYYDHFGVHAAERTVDLGSSDELRRTATKITGEWGGHKIELKYRAGITYIGKLTLPDGRTSEAKCNDLAMLDD